ncbi:hypothetical protein D3870_18040 [Noviherbaspirillum cavernae]|uniref:Uncharacterized protein n=1 Tax=Noviherbaspirillum cavernae TaxID=2320862 RepID=A0A418X583_9BURK|nr:hypothetical protein [Noviherbaspirillum cavernae]RJG07644.1 hypothetical protein D3870_18040 [Noviherbaspirillum cavernae]
MSLLAIAAIPVQAVLPAAEVFAGTAVNVARPLLGLSALVAFLMVFKPLLRGLLRAAVLTVAPRLSVEERNARSKVRGALMLNRLANAYDEFQPGQAAELRALAGRG